MWAPFLVEAPEKQQKQRYFVPNALIFSQFRPFFFHNLFQVRAVAEDEGNRIVAQEKTNVKATLIFAERPAVDFALLVESLKRPVRNIALEFDDIEIDQGNYLIFDSDKMTLRVALGRLPILEAGLICSKRPEDEDGKVADISELMQDYGYSMEVTVSDGLLGETRETTQLSACYHVVRHLLREFDVTLVKWHPTGVLFTASEFENPTELRAAVRPSRPKTTVTTTLGSPRSNRPNIVQSQHFSGAATDVASTHARLDGQLDGQMGTVSSRNMYHEEENDLGDTLASGRWNEVFPNLEDDAEEPVQKAKVPSFLQSLLVVEEVKLDAPTNKVETVEQLTVYVMTVTLMVLAFPIGFAMLIYNILGGENLRATPRAMALTGTGMGLYVAGLAPQFGMFV